MQIEEARLTCPILVGLRIDVPATVSFSRLPDDITSGEDDDAIGWPTSIRIILPELASALLERSVDRTGDAFAVLLRT